MIGGIQQGISEYFIIAEGRKDQSYSRRSFIYSFNPTGGRLSIVRRVKSGLIGKTNSNSFKQVTRNGAYIIAGFNDRCRVNFLAVWKKEREIGIVDDHSSIQSPFHPGSMDMDFPLIVIILVSAIHCQLVNIGGGSKFTQNISPGVKLWYNKFTGWRYIPPVNTILQEIIRLRMNLKDCLKECHNHNQGSAPKCIAVNWCLGRTYAGQIEKCQLETDTTEFITNLYVSHSRCILLSAGLVPGGNEHSIVKQDAKWDHYSDYDISRISVSDYGFE